METMRGPDAIKEKVEQLKQDSDIQKALDQTALKAAVTVPTAGKQKLFLGNYLLFLVLLSCGYYLIRLRLFHFGERSSFGSTHADGTMAIVTVLVLARALDLYFVGRVEDSASKYNIKRIRQPDYRAGHNTHRNLDVVCQLVYGSGLTRFGLPHPWIRAPNSDYKFHRLDLHSHFPYRVGDRIKIGEATGDVIDVGYLDTMLWEFGGEYLSTDHPSGRVIKFPNSNVLSTAVYNYSWPQ
jgi:hypothetical protein